MKTSQLSGAGRPFWATDGPDNIRSDPFARPSFLRWPTWAGSYVLRVLNVVGLLTFFFDSVDGRLFVLCVAFGRKVKTLYELLRSCWVSFHGISQINSTFYQIDWHLKLFRDFGRCLGIATEMRCFSSNLCLCSKVFDELGYINKKADSNIAQINKARRSHGWLNISMIFEFIRHVIVLLTKHCFTRKVNIKFARLYNASIE